MPRLCWLPWLTLFFYAPSLEARRINGHQTKNPASTPKSVVRDHLAGGTHWAIRTPQGPIHLWRPGGYQHARAGIVLYVHGHNIQVNRAWKVFELAQQFQQSRQNALFIVPEAPINQQEKIPWPSLGALLRQVSRSAKIPLPRGHMVAVAHSGGYRTVVSWLDYRWLNHIILLDALYGNEKEFAHWVDQDKRAADHKLILVGSDTHQQSSHFIKQFSYAAQTKTIPDSYQNLSRREKRARVLYLKSQYGHNEMVQNAKVLPLLLRNTRLKHL